MKRTRATVLVEASAEAEKINTEVRGVDGRPVAAVPCGATGCRRRTRNASGFCYQHEDMARARNAGNGEEVLDHGA